EVRRHTADVLGLPDDDEYTIVVSDEIFHSTNPEFTDLYLYQYSDGEKSSNVLALPADDPRIEYLLTESRSTDPTSLAHTIPTKNLTDNDRELIISKYTQEQRETTRHAIGNFLETNHIAGGFNFDPWTDTFILGLDTTQLNGKTLPTTDIPITTEQATVSTSAYNDGMQAPYRGGGAIYNYGGQRCTSGIPAIMGSTRGYFTAGHCFDNGARIYSRPQAGANYFTGKVTSTIAYPRVDAQFISGVSYAGQVIVDNSGTSWPVAGLYRSETGPGHLICFTGSTSGAVCDNYVQSYKGSYCDGTCYYNLIELFGGRSCQKGDSGGTVYGKFGKRVKVSGIISGFRNPFIGRSTTYVTPWEAIAIGYNARVITE
ncbi:hypothetical protein, partial [Trueperella sp. LYQ141]|uniref:hypothetical protein n=1 Tax=Trueperella sp. LYQ141 TaxID=3391058 RepID=UPI0039833630